MKRNLVLALGALLALPSAAAAHGPPKINSGPTGTVNVATATFTFSYGEPAPMQKFECQLDNGAWEACGDFENYGPQGGTGTKTYSNLAEGVHSFRVRRVSGLPTPVDPLNDPTASEPRTWLVDTTPDAG
jgi:hypothetical protein